MAERVVGLVNGGRRGFVASGRPAASSVALPCSPRHHTLLDKVEYDREFLTGTVGVLILSLLSERPMYGYEILREAEGRSARQFQMKEGTLYPALHAMERAGFLKAEWRVGENGRSRKYYALTAKGRRQAVSKRRQWDAISAAMRSILGEAHG